MRLLLLFILACSLHLLHAQDINENKNETSFIDRIRPYLVSAIGDEWTKKILGDEGKKFSLKMPKIPTVTVDATSTAVYSRKADIITVRPEVEEKFNYAFINELFEVTRQTKPNDDETTKLMNVLSQGGSREGVYRSLVLDSTYAGMENWDRPVKSKAADFAVYFYETYFAKKIAKKSFEGMSLYTLKRLVAEKALDVADAFGSNRKDLETWYALMSSDMAQRFPQVWGNNKMRKNISAEDQKNWASRVPIQHIKSEIIIKLHSAFNTFF